MTLFMLETKAVRGRKGTNKWGRVVGEGWVIKYNDMPILNTIKNPSFVC